MYIALAVGVAVALIGSGCLAVYLLTTAKSKTADPEAPPHPDLLELEDPFQRVFAYDYQEPPKIKYPEAAHTAERVWWSNPPPTKAPEAAPTAERVWWK